MLLPRATCPTRRFGLAAAALAIVAASAFAARHQPGGETAATSIAWSPTRWNLPLDNWGQGQAWRTTLPGGTTVQLFARTKTGFCNCFNGIADDTEIDRIGDVDLHGDNFSPTAQGEPVSAGDLMGRQRAFQTSNRWTGARHVLSIVTATECKAVVATLVSDQAISRATETSAIALLNGDSFRYWAANQ